MVQHFRRSRHSQGVSNTLSSAPSGDGVVSSAASDDATVADEVWFSRLVTDQSTRIFRFFARRAPQQDADDLTSEVFLTAWRRRDVVPRDDTAVPWLYVTADFVLANHRRRRADIPVGEIPDEPAPGRVGFDPELTAVVDDDLRRALALVGERDRRILLLNAWDGLDGVELAAVLGLSRSGGAAALSRARSRLREAWEKLGLD